MFLVAVQLTAGTASRLQEPGLAETEFEILLFLSYFWAASAAKNCEKNGRDRVGRERGLREGRLR